MAEYKYIENIKCRLDTNSGKYVTLEPCYLNYSYNSVPKDTTIMIDGVKYAKKLVTKNMFNAYDLNLRKEIQVLNGEYLLAYFKQLYISLADYSLVSNGVYDGTISKGLDDSSDAHWNAIDFAYLYEYYVANQAPTITGSDENLGEKNNAFSITYQVNDTDSSDMLTIIEKLNGTTLRTLTNQARNTDITLSISQTQLQALTLNQQNTIEISVSDGNGATTYRRYTFTRTNSVPVITYTGDDDLGALTTKPTVTYSVSDLEGDTITIIEKINGEQTKTFTATANTSYTFQISNENWLRCTAGTNTITIIATDSQGASSTKEITFTRTISKIQVLSSIIDTDAKANKILAVVSAVTTGATLLVEACNNANDTTPTWENITTATTSGNAFTFTNTTKTADNWGVRLRLTLTKNEGTTDTVEIKGFGGSFE